MGQYTPTSEWSGLQLIYIRNNCWSGVIRIENALEEAVKSGTEIPTSQRKNTEELIETLRGAMYALQDLESEKNICNHNSILERTAHTITQIKLQEAEKQNNKLRTEGDNLRRSLSKFMRQ